jgi:hypothetical protein
MQTPRYWLGLLMFCMAAMFAVCLGSVLQYRAIAHQQAVSASYETTFTASLLPPTALYRKASLGYY